MRMRLKWRERDRSQECAKWDIGNGDTRADLEHGPLRARLSQGRTANTLDRTDNWGGQRALRSRACNRYRQGTEIDKIREFEELAKVLLTVQM